MQFPDAVLNRLPALRPDAPTGARRLRALAYLGPLVHLYTGRHELRVDSAPGSGGGMAALSGHIKVPVMPFWSGFRIYGSNVYVRFESIRELCNCTARWAALLQGGQQQKDGTDQRIHARWC